MPRQYEYDTSKIPCYDNDPEFQNFDFMKYLCSEEDFPQFYKEEKQPVEDKDIEEITEQMEKLDLNTLKVSQLKRMCKENGIKGYSKKKKNELVNLLKKLKL